MKPKKKGKPLHLSPLTPSPVEIHEPALPVLAGDAEQAVGHEVEVALVGGSAEGGVPQEAAQELQLQTEAFIAEGRSS